MAPRPLAMVMAMALLAISSGIKGRPSKVKTRLKALSKVPGRGARNPPRAARFGGGRLAMGRAAVAAAAAAAAAEAQRGGVRGGQRDIRVAFQRRPPAGGSGKKSSEMQDQQDEMEEEDQQPRQQQFIKKSVILKKIRSSKKFVYLKVLTT